MNIIVTGIDKSGTTVIANRIATSFHLDYCHEPKHGLPTSLLEGTVKTSIYHIKKYYDSFDKKIMVVRDPRDRLISGFVFAFLTQAHKSEKQIRKIIEMLEEKESHPEKVTLIFLIEKIFCGQMFATKFQIDHTRKTISFLKEHPEYFVVKYENFVDDNVSSLEEYLGIRLETKYSLEQRAYLKRRGHYGDWRNWFTDKDVAILQPEFSEYMKIFNYGSEDWLLNKTPIIQKEHCSDYVKMLINKGRKEFKLKSIDW